MPLVLDTATNRLLPNATLLQLVLDGNVLDAHVKPPSVELAACVPPLATATNFPPPYATLVQDVLAGKPPPDTHVWPPSVEYAFAVPPEATATQRPLP